MMKSDAKIEELIALLLSAGMNRKEAENFCQQGNTILQQVLQIDGKKAAEVIPLIAEMGLISGVITIRIGVEQSRHEDFVALLEKACKQEVIQASDFTGELESRTEPWSIGPNLDVDPGRAN
jgi:hypothetical protein